MADHLGYISSLAFNPDGTRLASVDSLGAIKIWHGLPNEKSASQGMKIRSNENFLFLFLFKYSLIVGHWNPI
jgi:WD40 repeat protein